MMTLTIDAKELEAIALAASTEETPNKYADVLRWAKEIYKAEEASQKASASHDYAA